ncbi:hypothetical protein M405DRAFT_869514 [Rhizopogon salebrosus TDB-379]|nr:hypothetical protein M405DRAFT_869514 [Rhizopogon salebrosus TDB-379]
MQWNVELEEAFIITTPDSARLDTMSTPVSTCVFFAMRDMIDVLITHVHLLPDVLAVRQLSREIYSWCRGVPQRRLVGILHRSS